MERAKWAGAIRPHGGRNTGAEPPVHFNLDNRGVRHDFTDDGDGTRRALMWSDDSSWALAESRDGALPALVQGGPRRLWDALDTVHERWLREGKLPATGGTVRSAPSARRRPPGCCGWGG